MQGISAGSSWPSPSSITTAVPSALAKPRARAADFPEPLVSGRQAIRLSLAAAAVTSVAEPSVEPSSITSTSQRKPAASSAVAISVSSGPMLPASFRTGMTRVTCGEFGGVFGMDCKRLRGGRRRAAAAAASMARRGGRVRPENSRCSRFHEGLPTIGIFAGHILFLGKRRLHLWPA